MNFVRDTVRWACRSGFTYQSKILRAENDSMITYFHPALTRCLRTTKISSQVNAESSPIAITNVITEEMDKLYRTLEVEVRGNDPAVLKSYSWFATTAAGELGVKVGNCWALRKANHDRMTLLKSVHIYKKHRVQYEIRTYFRFMQFHQLTGSTADTFLEYIERNLPEGVAMKVTRVGIQKLPEYITSTSTAKAKSET